MSDNWLGGTNWFNAANWSLGVPANMPRSDQTVVINGSLSQQPTISPTVSGAIQIYVAQTLTTGPGASTLSETQIDGEFITLANHADLTIQGIAMGVFYDNNDVATASGATMTGLHGALTATPTADMHMQVSVVGTDTLTVDTINENFGYITIGGGDTLSIANIETGGNAQALHGLINYGEISVSSGGLLNITDQAPNNGTVANFYNAGWIVDNGGTLNISSSVLDGASKLAANGGVDGFIELGHGALAMLSGTVGTGEQVDFLDGLNDTLQISAGSQFAGTVNGFATGDTINLTGFTAASNVTITAVGGVTELITANGNVPTTITLTGSIASNFSDGIAGGQEYITAGGGTISGAVSYAGGTETLANGTGTLLNNGTVTITGASTALLAASSLTGNGAFYIDYGATLALDNATGNDAAQKVIFGTHGAAGAPNTLLINDDTQGFGGSVTGFGSNDEIVLGSKVLTQPSAGSSILLNYANGVLTVEDTSSSTGAVLSSTSITLSGTQALSTASFVALQSAAGEVIELASTASFVFSIASQSTGNFETPANFTGGVAPGDLLVPGETVTIASGTATVASGGITDNGTIAITSTFIDAGTLAGSGTIIDNGTLSLGSGGSVGSIIDNGRVILSGGTLTAPVSIAAGAHLSISSAATVSGPLSGAGTLSVGGGVNATLSNGAGVATIRDNGTLDIAGSISSNVTFGNGAGVVVVDAGHSATLSGAVSLNAILDSGTLVLGDAAAVSTINMQGNGANSVVNFRTTGALSTPLINFGLSDEIILGGTALTTPVPGTSAALLSYANGILTVQDTANATGSVISTANLTVGSVAGSSAFSAGSFVALNGVAGEVIELAASLPGQSFDFSIPAGSTGSFETPADYTGGIAPGDTLLAGETVTIGAGTASVSSGGVTDNGVITIASGAAFIDGTSLSGSGTLAVAGSATLTGATTLAAITDAGTLTLGGADAVAINITGQANIAANFSDSAAITGTGTLGLANSVTATLASGSSLAAVADFGTLDLSGSMGGSINMEGNGAGSVADFLGADATAGTLNTALTNFGYSDTLLLGPAAFAVNAGDHLTESYDAATGQVSITDSNTGGHITIDLEIIAGDPASYLQVIELGGQVELTLCFYAGTALAAPGGEIKVENLNAGDVLMTANGPMPVRWVGQSHIHTDFADQLRSLPIRIRQNALGVGLPVRDLLLSPDHAIAMDGILVQASALVNGTSIIREYGVPTQFIYYHVELDSHELLLAEGVAAESFVDNTHRMHFHNWDERTAPDTEIMEMPLPRAKSVRQLPRALRARLGLDTVAAA